MFEYDQEAILADQNAHPIHKHYARINIGVRDRGEKWSKCHNCGDPYRSEQNEYNMKYISMCCSRGCMREFTDDLYG